MKLEEAALMAILPILFVVAPLAIYLIVALRKTKRDITADEFYGRLVSARSVTTSQPSPGRLLACYQRAAEEGEVLRIANLLCPGIIAISGTNRACERAADLAEDAGAMKAIPLAMKTLLGRAGNTNRVWKTLVWAGSVTFIKSAISVAPTKPTRTARPEPLAAMAVLGDC